jgi:mannose-6-phosphate isomerase-like protein (cupin superfamily)
MTAPIQLPPALRMPGAILMSRLKVYETPTPDGQIGGTPHVHLVCTEMYFVLSGSGAVELLDKDGFRRVELRPYEALLFTPGTIHRLINPNRDLEILVMMQNSGLPERGDNVVTFTNELLSDDSSYADAMRVSSIDDAYRRRDRGVEGFLQLKAAFETSAEEGLAALERFYQQAAARTSGVQAQWREMVEQGALAEAQTSLAQLDQLAENDTSYLLNNGVGLVQPPESPALGFCGHLNRYFDPATLLPQSDTYTPEGIRQP